MSRAQVAVETLFILAFLIAMLLPVIYLLYATLRAHEWITESYTAHATLARIVESANKLAYAGDGAIATVSVNFPRTTRSFVVRDRELVLSLDTELGRIDVVALANVNISLGKLKPSGTRRLLLNYSGGKVWLREA